MRYSFEAQIFTFTYFLEFNKAMNCFSQTSFKFDFMINVYFCHLFPVSTNIFIIVMDVFLLAQMEPACIYQMRFHFPNINQ